MDRRDFIKHSSAAAAAASLGAGAAAANATRDVSRNAAPHVATSTQELRLCMPWTQNGRGFDDSARRLAQAIATASDGRYRIVVIPTARGLDCLNDGSADLYHGSGHDLVALDPAFAYFAGLPGGAGLRPTYLNAWLMAGGGQTLWDNLAAQHGFKPLLAGHSGARAKLWSREPVTSENGRLDGWRIAAPGLGANVVRALGAEAITLNPADLPAALREGHVDAVEWGGTIAGYACDLHQAARHCLRPGLSRGGFTSVLAVRSDLWADMQPTHQAAITFAASHELNTVVAESLSIARNLRLALTERHGVTFTAMPAGVEASAKAAAETVVAQVAAGSPVAGRIHASYMAFRAGLPATRRRSMPRPMA